MPVQMTVRIHDQCALADTRTIWLPAHVLSACQAEANSKFPNETGGTFMGWWANDTEAVITAMIGPGPNAHHEFSSFEPDQNWQLEKISGHYLASNRRETYLGDWHSHPGASHGDLSWWDRRVLRKIATSKPARCPRPLMLIFWGDKEQWRLSAWSAEILKRRFLWGELHLASTMVRITENEIQNL